MTFKPLLVVMMVFTGMMGLHAQIDTVLPMDRGPAYRQGGIVYDTKNDVLFAVGPTYDIWRSLDGGITFEQAGAGFPVVTPWKHGPFPFVFDNGEYVLISATVRGAVLYRSSDQGRTFTPDEAPVGSNPQLFMTDLQVSRTMMWSYPDSLLSLDAGRSWIKLHYPHTLDIGFLWRKILSEHRIAVADMSIWRYYDIRTGEWTVLDIPVSSNETLFQLVDDSTLIWVEDGALMIGEGIGGRKKRIDHIYLPGSHDVTSIKPMDVLRHRDEIVVLDSSGIVAVLEDDSLIALSERRFVPPQHPMTRISLKFQSIGTTDVVMIFYPTRGWGVGVDVDVIDIGRKRHIRSFHVPYLSSDCKPFLLRDTATVVIENGQGEMIRIPADDAQWTSLSAQEREPVRRPKSMVLDGHALSDGTVLALTEYGRWIRNDRTSKTMEIVFNDGSRIFDANGLYISERLRASVSEGYPRAVRYDDTVYTTGKVGLRMSVDGKHRDTLRDSSTTYAYRDPDERIYMGTYDVRWTMDNGRTWTVGSVGLPDRGPSIRPHIGTVLKTSDGSMVVGLRGFERGNKDVIADSVPGGIYYSIDDGMSWLKAEGLDKRDYVFNIVEVDQRELIAVVGHVIVDLVQPGASGVWAIGSFIQNRAIVRSSDGGRTWQIASESTQRMPFINHQGSILRSRTDRVVVLMSERDVMMSTDNGKHWDYENNSPLWLANIRALDTDESGRLHYFTDHGVFRQSTPTSVDDDIVPQDISMDVRLVDGALHSTFTGTDMKGTTITIVDIQGRTMRSFAVEGEFRASVAGLSSGLYVVTASGQWGRTSQSVVVVR